ncbi:MAG: class I SAM-dependent methyltransferase, partial [Polaromonas sp.]|nr:class I SAM-dependent methyltransferase [Polaromonas sp.]
MSVEEATLHHVLVGGLAQLQLELNDHQIGQLLLYQALIAKWTKVYNLTAVRDPAEMMTHHLLDSLAVIKSLQNRIGQGKLLDVGSGAGLPGAV